MKKRELTPQDEAVQEWLNRNKTGLILFGVLLVSFIVLITYLCLSNDNHYEGGCSKPSTEITK